MFLEWHQIGKWFSRDDVGKDITSNTGSRPWTDSAENLADTPILMLSAFHDYGASGILPKIVKEGDVIYFRSEFENYTDDPNNNYPRYKAGLRIAINPNKATPNQYPYVIKYKARINNPQQVSGYESTFNFLNICNIDKKIINGRYRLCFNSTQNKGLTTNTPLSSGSEIEYPLSDNILNGDWFEVEILWSSEKETVRIDGYSIGSDSLTTSKLNSGSNEFHIVTAYNWSSECPRFDISDIEVKRIYERTVTPPTLKITKEDGENNTVILTAHGFTDVVPDDIQD